MQEPQTKNLVFVEPSDDLKTVLSCFKIEQISHVPVMSEDKVVGMISKTDIVEYLYDQSEDLGTQNVSEMMKNIKAKQLMMQPLVEAKTTDSEMLIIEKLLAHQISSVVINDEEGDPVGILTDKDLLRYLLREKEDDMGFGEKLGLHLAQWLDKHGILAVSKALSDIGI